MLFTKLCIIFEILVKLIFAIKIKSCCYESDQCKPGWRRFEDSCYLFQMALRLSWSQAEQNCVNKGGHLASVHNQEENNFIKRWYCLIYNNVTVDFLNTTTKSLSSTIQ